MEENEVIAMSRSPASGMEIETGSVLPSSSIMTQPQSKLLSLPPELQRRILQYVLSTSKTVSGITEELAIRLRAYHNFKLDGFTDCADDDNDSSTTDTSSERDDNENININATPSEMTKLSLVNVLEEKGQRRLCHLFPFTCDHKDGLWRQPYPQVLATCRQLWTNGKPLLPTNKAVQVTYHFKDDESDVVRCSVAGELSISAALEKYPSLRDVQSWLIHIYFDVDYGDLDILEFCGRGMYRWRSQIEADVEAMRTMKGLKTLNIETLVMDENSEVESDDRLMYFQFFCNPFRVLKATNCYVQTADFALGSKIAADILKSEPAYDMRQAQDRLSWLINDIFDQTSGQIWDQCAFADAKVLNPYSWRMLRSPVPPLPHVSTFGKEYNDLRFAWQVWILDDVKQTTLKVLQALHRYLDLAAEAAAEQKKEAEEAEKTNLSNTDRYNRFMQRHWAQQWSVRTEMWMDEIRALQRMHEALQ